MNRIDWIMADILKELEPAPKDSDPELVEWTEWRNLCEAHARFVSRHSPQHHADFMQACGL